MTKIKTIENSHLKRELIIKKSRFIGEIFYVQNIENISKLAEMIKKENKKANHVAFAYRIGVDQINEYSTDGGEPAGTAGNPILNVLQQNNLTDVVLFITRYFGGIKLGTGGLTRAYSNTAIELFDELKIKDIVQYTRIEVLLDYDSIDKLKRLLNKKNITIESEKYETRISLFFSVAEADFADFESDFIQIFNSKYTIKKLEHFYSS